MKNRKNGIGIEVKKFGFIGLAAAILCLGGCGSSQGFSSTSTADTAAPVENASGGYASDDIYEMEYSQEAAEEEGTGGNESVSANRKLIRTIHMSVETEEFDTLVARLEQRVADLGGYIENMNVYNGSLRNGQRSRDASMVVRIPKGKLDMFVSEVSEASNVVSKSENTEDVTLSYVDLESRKKALQVEQERLLELLEQAVSMEDIITIEERLSQVRYELESMESQLRTYDNLVDFSTVYLSVDEVEVLTPVEEISDFSRMAQGFGRSVANLLKGIKEFLIGLVISLPYLIFVVILAVAAVLLVKAFMKKSRKKKEEQLSRIYSGNRIREGQEAEQAQKEEICQSEAGSLGTGEKEGLHTPEANCPEPGINGGAGKPGQETLHSGAGAAGRFSQPGAEAAKGQNKQR